MSRSYIKAIKECLPDVEIVFDRFHVIKLLNDAIDEVRKRIYQQLNQKSRKALKNSRFLILRNSSNLLPEEKARLEVIFEKYEVLGIAYLLKEGVKAIWNIRSPIKAREAFVNWALDVISLVIAEDNDQLKPLYSFARTLLNHLDGIMAYWRHQISNGRAEGLNNKIKTLKRQAYGFRDDDYFKLRLYHLHAQKHRLSG